MSLQSMRKALLMTTSFFLLLSELLVDAFAPTTQIKRSRFAIAPNTSPFRSVLFATMGPIARAKKAMDPEDYERVVTEKMERDGLTRQEAEDEYNSFLEQPSYYYSLDKKEEYYKSLGYKDIFDGMIGEAEKEGRGEEVREQLKAFRRNSQIMAYIMLALVFTTFAYAYNLYHEDPSSFLTGLPVREVN